MLLSVLIAALSIWAVTAQWKGFSLDAFLEDLQQADWRWFVPAVLCMLGYVLFEALALGSVCREIGYPRTAGQACIYAASDIFFSAITPSASGGQPACALLMIRDGIPATVTTAVLLLTLAMYALAILAIGVLCLVFRPQVFWVFGTTGRFLIVIGFAAQIVLAILFFFLLLHDRLLESTLRRLLHLLSKLRLVRNEEKWQRKLRNAMVEYHRCTAILGGHRNLLLRSFLFNFLQRASQIAVTAFSYLAMGGSLRLMPDIFAMQSYVVIGSNCVPIPGAMGVADYLMLDGFENFLPADLVVSMELLSRGLSFYCCVLLCGVFVFAASLITRKGKHP